MSFHLILLILHVLGAGVVIGIVVLALVAVIKPPVTAQAMDRLHFVSRFGMGASIWQFLTGLIMSIQDWDEFRGNRLFWTKIILYVVEGALASRLLARQSRQTYEQTLNGQTTKGNRLRTTLSVHAGLIVAIAVIGVVLVSGGEE